MLYGVSLLQILAPEVAIEVLTHTVNHRRISLQLHSLSQPPGKHTGNLPRSLACPVSFSTIDARISASYADANGTSSALLAHAAASSASMVPQRPLQELKVGHATRELVGVRERTALPVFTWRPRRAISYSLSTSCSV